MEMNEAKRLIEFKNIVEKNIFTQYTHFLNNWIYEKNKWFLVYLWYVREFLTISTPYITTTKSQYSMIDGG